MKNNYKGALPIGYRLSGESFCYEIEKVLGQGSFGITYLAHIIFEGKLGSLKKIKQLVAIKEFYMCDINSRNESYILEGSSAETFRNYHHRFRKEAENLSKMDHPGIVDVMEIFEANGTSYYVMDFLPGGTLLEHIKEHGKLPSKEALQLILKIGEALGYMHAQRMLHLDLKPSNIGMTETKEPVLIDFGLSKVFTENGMPESTTGIGGGTPGYSPLEQMNYNPKNGLALTLDIYALGGTLFKALTGMNPPYATMLLDDDDALTSRMIESKVSPEVMELVTWAMSPRKKDRPQNVETFSERARSVLQNLCCNDEDSACEEIAPNQSVDSSLFFIEKEEDDEYLYMNAKENHLNDPSFERSFIPVHHFEDIHGFRCRLDYSLSGDKRNALERLLSDMSTNVLPDSQMHYHPMCRPEIDTIQYGRSERTGIPGIFFTTQLHDWIENLEFLRSTTGLPFRFGTPNEVLEYARMLKDGALTRPTYMCEEMFALDPVSSKFSIINLTTGESSTFNLNKRPHANILLVCDVTCSPLEGIYGFDEIQSFGYAFFKRPNHEGCDILDNQMNVLRISPSFDYDFVWHEQYGLYDNPPKSDMPLYKNGEPYIGNIFYIRENERESTKWPEICHIGPGMNLVPGMMEESEDTDPYESNK